MPDGRFDVSGVFRDEWPRLVARLVRDFGDVELAEDAAQEAFIEASRRWSTDTMPKAPPAWLLTTARRKAIDALRRAKRMSEHFENWENQSVGHPLSKPGPDREIDDQELIDDQLALLLGCCHPALSFEAQVSLTLRIVAGLSSAQIARSFFVSESAMTRRLTRSKTKIRATNIAFNTSNLETLRDRLPVICAIVYSIFTEGHASANATTLVRGDLCDEAIWLGSLVRALVPNDPEVAGLHALMLLIDARRESRTDYDGRPVLLADQDRSLWDRDQIDAGLNVLAEAYSMQAAGIYQLQAAIAAVHATAATFAETNWTAIVDLYDALVSRQPSAILGLNRAIAIAERDGPQAGLDALTEVQERTPFASKLTDYPYFHAARAEMLYRLGMGDSAVAAFNLALDSAANQAEHHHIKRRIEEIQATSGR